MTFVEQSNTAMEVQVISEHVVKPSSPTPPHLKTYKLSVLDQLMPPAHVPMVFFYANHSDDGPTIIDTKITRIRESLSVTLTSIYMFAGRIKDDLLYIDCNDEGIPYFEAKVNCPISEFLTTPDRTLIGKLLPQVPSETGLYLVGIQVNIFSCGGIAIGTKTSHRIIDGPTSTTLLHLWGANARGRAETPIKPDFSAPTLFPQEESLPRHKMLAIWPSLLKFGRCVTRRFVFNAGAIATLKANAGSPSSYVEHPSRVEAVAAFVWQRAAAISKARYGYQKPSAWTHTVNLRGKKGMSTNPISDHAIGNMIWLATAQCNGEEADAELPALVGAQRRAITKLIADGVGEKLQGRDGYGKIQECLEEFGKTFGVENTDHFMCSSVCKVGVYESDFGWGKPIWVCPGGLEGFVYQNLVFLIETPGKADGIEVWVTLGEEDMAILEADEKLLNFASLDPSPMDLQ